MQCNSVVPESNTIIEVM
uniref:THAP domaincontaining protein 6like [Xiphosphorus maculatus] n=1 Tax=Lepeophtheirus salmonis TaxID=72036 RepID=A0A0K2UD76_LEPSM